MKKIIVASITIALSIIIVNVINGQVPVEINKKEFKISKDGFREAMNAIKYGDNYYASGSTGGYRLALTQYLKAYEYNQNNPELNYKIGACYLYSTDKSKARGFLKKAYNAKPGVASDIYYLLGWGYHINCEFDEAINYYRKYKNETIESGGKKSKKSTGPIIDVDKKIRECETGKNLISNPIRVFIDNLGPAVNSKFPDYAPVISTDESVLIFTSRRDGSTGGEIDPNDLMPYEDLYISYNEDKKGWTQAINMRSLNTEAHES